MAVTPRNAQKSYESWQNRALRTSIDTVLANDLELPMCGGKYIVVSDLTAVVGWTIWDRLLEGKNHRESAVKNP